jgi:predicted transcriptional regulator
VAPFDELKPVKKFTSRKTAVTRIWQAIARLAPDVAQSAADVAPAKAPRRARVQKAATEARSDKKAEVIAMMKRAKGATLAEITEATGWQKHTVRGFVNILGSKGGEKIESTKNAAGERSYRIN